MNFSHKNTCILLSVFISVFLIVVSFIYLKEKKENNYMVDIQKIIDAPKKYKEWKAFGGEYSFQYPDSIKRILTEGSSLYLSGDGFSGIKIFLYKTDIKNIDQWYKYNSDEGVIEDRINLIGGHPAIILSNLKYETKTHDKESIKKLVSIINGNILEIYTRDIDHSRFWANFNYSAKKEEKKKVYINDLYGYSVEYPYNNQISESKDKSEVSFNNLFNIKIKKTNITNIWDWYKENKDKLIMEKTVNIDGRNFFVFHNYGGAEDFLDEKSAVYIENNLIFRLNTSYIEHDEVWSSFRFLK